MTDVRDSETETPLVGQLLVAAFNVSRQAHGATGEQWIKASFRAGGAIPESAVFVSIQRIGDLDLLCRALEDELLRVSSPEGAIDLRLNYLMLISDLWIGAAYAITYALTDRGLYKDHAAFQDLAEDLRVVRVQLEKHQIASDRRLDQPLDPVTAPGQPGEVRSFQYDKNNRLRAHIGRTGLSARRSAMWELVDVKANTMRWVERRDLADRMLQIFTHDAL